MGGQWAGVARLRYDGFIDSGAAASAAPGGCSDVPAARVHCLSGCSLSRLGLAGCVSFGDGIAAVGANNHDDSCSATGGHSYIDVGGRRARRSDGDAHHRGELNRSQFHADNHPNFPAALANARRRTGARPVYDARATPVHAGYLCYLAPVATADFPFLAQDVELEGERIYVGGSDGQQLYVAVLDRTALPEIRQLAALTFPVGDWSVVGKQLLTVDSETAAVTVSDVSDLSTVTTRQVAVPFDAQWNVMGQPQLFEDTLWLMIGNKGLMTVTGLLDAEPMVLWREFHSYFAIDFVTMQETHTFVADNWCDASDCAAYVDIAGRNPEGEFAHFSLYPHHPVFHYHAIGNDIVWAFSDYSLIVIDLTAPAGREIVRTYPLRGRLNQ